MAVIVSLLSFGAFFLTFFVGDGDGEERLDCERPDGAQSAKSSSESESSAMVKSKMLIKPKFEKLKRWRYKMYPAMRTWNVEGKILASPLEAT